MLFKNFFSLWLNHKIGEICKINIIFKKQIMPWCSDEWPSNLKRIDLLKENFRNYWTGVRNLKTSRPFGSYLDPPLCQRKPSVWCKTTILIVYHRTQFVHVIHVRVRLYLKKSQNLVRFHLGVILVDRVEKKKIKIMAHLNPSWTSRTNLVSHAKSSPHNNPISIRVTETKLLCYTSA